MQNASKVANGYKTILTNLMTKDLESQFNKFGLTMRKQNGEMKDGFTIIQELSAVYQDLGTKLDEDGESTVSLSDDMNKLLKDIAGSHNINVLTAGLSNFNQAINASQTAIDSAGSAQEEYAVAMDTFKKKLEGLEGEFQRLIVGEGGLSQFLKLLIDGGTAVLKFANSDLGQLIIKTTLFLTAIKLLNSGLAILSKTTIANVIKDFIALKTEMVTVTSSTLAIDLATKGLTATLLASAKAWALTPFGMATIAIGSIYGIVKAVDALTLSLDEAKEQTQESIENNKGLQSEFDSLIDSVDGLSDASKEYLKNIQVGNQAYEDKFDTLISKNGTLNEAEKNKLELLKAQIEANKTLIQQEYEKESGKRDEQDSNTRPLGQTGTNYWEGSTDKQSGAIKLADDEKASIMGLIEAYGALDESKAKSLDEEDKIISAKNKIIKRLTEEGLHLEDLEDSGIKLTRADKKRLKAINKLIQGINKKNKAESKGANISQKEADASLDNADAINEQADAEEALKDKISDNINEFTSMYDTFEDLNDIVKDYNDGNGLTSDSLTKLLNMDSKYLALLEEKDGKLVLNKKAMVELANAQIDEAEASAVANTMLEIQNNTTGDNTGSLQSLANQAGITSGSLINITQDIIGMATSAGNATTQIQNMFSALGGQGKVGDNKANEEAVKGLQNTIKLLENQRKNISSHINSIGSASKATHRNTGSTGKNTSARDKNRKAIEKQNKALDKQTKILEEREKILEKELDERDEVFDYFEDLIDKEIEALEDAKDKELSGIEDKIEAIEKEQEAYNEATDDKIETLEDEKDAIDEYYDNELEKLEEENKAIEENIRLRELQDNLAKAKTQKVKVFKNGQFTYEADEEAINKAQSELLNYKEESSKQKAIDDIEARRKADLAKKDADIKDLENESKTKNKNWKADIKELEEDYEEAEDEWDARIEKYEGYQKELDRIRNYYENKNKKHLANQYINEKKNWEDRLKALKKFAQGYERISKKLENVRKAIDKVTEIKEKNKDNPKKKRAKQAKKVTATAVKQSRFQKHRYYAYDKVKKKRLYTTPFYDDINDAKKDMNDWFYKKPKKDRDNIIRKHQAKRYAKGSYGLPNDQIVLVGDPNNISNRELVVGSKLNKGDGILADAQAGTGIIPHGNNLTEQLVKLANWSQNGGFERVSNNTSNSSVVQIENINLPQVKNGEEFVSYLENNFVNQAFQYASTRR